MSKMNPKKLSTIIHTQFNYNTLTVTPFQFQTSKTELAIDQAEYSSNSKQV